MTAIGGESSSDPLHEASAGTAVRSCAGQHKTDACQQHRGDYRKCKPPALHGLGLANSKVAAIERSPRVGSIFKF